MRRKDREITTFTEIQEVIFQCVCIHLGMCLDNVPYVCTMNFGLSIEGKPCFYLHCASEGRKIEILKQQPKVSFVMNCEHHFVDHPVTHHQTMEYLSVAGSGSIEFVEELEEKRKALNNIVEHYSTYVGSYDQKTLENVTILKCVIDEITGKRNIKEKADE